MESEWETAEMLPVFLPFVVMFSDLLKEVLLKTGQTHDGGCDTWSGT